MPRALRDSTRSDQLPFRSTEARAGLTAKRIRLAASAGWILLAIALVSIGWADAVAAQDWGESDDGWSSESTASSGTGGSSARYDPPTTAWSLRAGIGFTIDPDTFLMNFELPYRFDQYVSAGPMMQIGVENDRFIVAPTVNVALTIPDLPGENLDRFQPNLFAGIGFAVLGNDDRGGDHESAGFLVNAGFGVDYLLSQRVSIGSRMILNFLPERTLDERFWYSWEIGSIRISF